MDTVLNWLWQGCAIALAAGVALRLLNRVRGGHRYAVCWIALLIVLALPWTPLIALGPAVVSHDTATTADAMLAVPAAWWTSSVAILCSWTVWCLVYGVRVAGDLVALRRARRGCLPFPADVESRLRCWNTIRARGRRTRLSMSRNVRSAAVLGCGPPVVAVSPGLLDSLGVAELDGVIVHEWAHIQRRDDLLNLAHLAVRGFAGWHPAVWWLVRQLDMERENACDEIATSVTGSPKRYAASLTTAAGLVADGRQQASSRPLPMPGALASTGLARRVVRILAHGQLASRRCSATVATCVTFTLCALSATIAGLQVVSAEMPLTRHGALAANTARVTGEDAPAAPRRARSSTQGEQAGTPPPAPRPRKTSGTRPGSPETAAPEVRITHGRPVTNDSAALVFTSVPIPTLDSTAIRGFSPAAIAYAPELAAKKLQSGHATRNEEFTATPWSVAADAGVALGRASQTAAVSTGGYLSRAARKIATSF